MPYPGKGMQGHAWAGRARPPLGVQMLQVSKYCVKGCGLDRLLRGPRHITAAPTSQLCSSCRYAGSGLDA